MNLFSTTDVPDLKCISKSAADRSAGKSRHERAEIRKIVIEFVLSHNRILFGGAALSELLGAADEGAADVDDSDVEFYSPQPGRDIVELCDLFRQTEGLDFIQGREAVHLSTLTVSIQFKRCIDVTYLHPRTFSSMPVILSARGLRCVHPHVMAIDLLRMMTEPDTSYWRLEKAFERMNLIEYHFPLSWGLGEAKAEAEAEGAELHPRPWQWDASLLDELLLIGGCVIVGSHAARFYETSLPMESTEVEGLQLVSLQYANDIRAVRRILFQHGLCAVVDEVSLDAFGDFLGRSTRFFAQPTPQTNPSGPEWIVEIIDAHPRCVPCSPNGRRVGSSLFCLVTAMACHLRAFITGDAVQLAFQSRLCDRLMRGRVMSREADRDRDDTFEDFGLDHILGQTTSDIRLHANTNKAWLRYNPSHGSSDDTPRRRMWRAAFAPRTGRIKSITCIQ